MPILPVLMWVGGLGLVGIGLYGAKEAQDTVNDTVRDIGEDVGRAGSVAAWVATGLGVVWLARWLKVI